MKPGEIRERLATAPPTEPDSFGANLEVYAFVAGVFFVLCYAMSQASYRLERAMGVGSGW